LDWFKKGKGNVGSGSKSGPSSPCSPPEYRYGEETETPFSPGPSKSQKEESLVSLPALGTQSISKTAAYQKREPAITLAVKLQQEESRGFLRKENSYLELVELPFDELDELDRLGRSPSKEEVLAFDWGPSPPIPRKSSKRRSHSQVCAAFACSLPF
jgi:hypothetical protein